jgi:ubiquinone/menaquinone biosynthesis C-methylase UbiE
VNTSAIATPAVRRESSRRSDERYASWQPAEVLGRTGRRRLAAAMLRRSGAFPQPGDRCLEVGYGRLGWLADLIGWGLREGDLHGIELDPLRAAVAQAALPVAQLRVGDAQTLPWDDGHFRLVVASTVFTSILDETVRSSLAGEIVRVLAPGGALIWYDLRVPSPGNSQVRAIRRREIRSLFPTLKGEIASATLAPILSRAIAPWSWTLATVLESVPALRTHWLSVLVKPQ